MTLIGHVEKFEDGYYVVKVPQAPSYLQLMHLVGMQMGKANVGDTVRLEYIVRTSGMWYVTEVL